MRIHILCTACLVAILASAFAPSLQAQHKEPRNPTEKELAEILKRIRKSLVIMNNSDLPWYVGIDKNEKKMTGSIEILDADIDAKKFKKVRGLKKGEEIEVPSGTQLMLTPVPEISLTKLKKLDFIANVYIKDLYNKKFYITVQRAANVSSDKKDCYFNYTNKVDMSVYTKIFAPEKGKGEFANSYVSLNIIGATLP